jgi:uncharacterized protein YbjT (DUF2867 family)
MPVIVVGADTERGRAIVGGLISPGREVRAFVSEPGAASELRRAGVKVATGDVSDESHVQGAASGCFTAVLVTEAARDERERAFASDEVDVLRGWARAAEAAGVSRVIWVTELTELPAHGGENARVSPSHPDLVLQVADLDNALRLAPPERG